MSSAPANSIETRSRRRLLAATIAALPRPLAPPRVRASYLAALPSTRAIETRSLPTSLAATHRGFAFYVAFPKAPFPDRDVFLCC